MKKWLNKIILGDCMELMKQLPDKCIDLVLTDPPYGKGAAEYDTSLRYGGWFDKYKNGKALSRTGGTLAEKYKKRFQTGTSHPRQKSLTSSFA